jgi:radical SAM superfamily enzyme YgiQ (UPF0313 family)
MKVTMIHLGGYERIYKQMRIAPLAFACLASVVPKGWDVEFVDESIMDIDFNISTDIVAISIQTPNAYRGYDVANKFRAKGRFVVFGGYHATIMPEEALLHCDAVVLGEGELAFAELLEDFAKGVNKKVYEHPIGSFDEIPYLDKTIFDAKNYTYPNSFQATRGCVQKCNFCVIRKVLTGYKTMPVDMVIDQIKKTQIGNFLQRKIVYFLDENISADKKYAKELFSRLRDLKIYFSTSGTIDFAEDDELVKMAKKAGCLSIFIGLESFKPESLRGAGKGGNRPDRYKKCIKTLHDNGIAVFGGLMFGFEEDDVSVFDEAFKMANELGLDIIQCAAVTPMPGTEYFEKLDKEGRILTKDWSLYDGTHVVYKPRNMTPEELEQGVFNLKSRFFSLTNIFYRLFIKSRCSILFTIMPNLYFRGVNIKNIPACALPAKIKR